MTLALINGTEIITTFEARLPGPYKLADQLFVAGDITADWPGYGTYSVVPVVWDSAPSADKVTSGDPAYEVAGNQVNATRVWVTPPAPVFAQCTRAQGLRALLHVGGMTNVEATIATAIATIPDPIKREDTQIAFGAANWYRADLISNAGLLSMTEAQVDALLAAAQGY